VTSWNAPAARKVECLLSYDLHVTRASHWTQSESLPIKYQQWLEYVAADPEIRFGSNTSDNYFEFVAHSNEPALLEWSRGEITAQNPDKFTVKKLLEIATKFGARVQGDDGEFYSDWEQFPIPTPAPITKSRTEQEVQAQLVWAGIVDADPAKMKETVVPGLKHPVLAESTRRVPARLGIAFGFALKFLGPGHHLPFHYRIIWKCTTPDTSVVLSDFEDRWWTGEPYVHAFMFEKDSELLPGLWSCEFRVRDRLLHSQEFDVYVSNDP
jgi:Domain of unknown function (DUF3859)